MIITVGEVEDFQTALRRAGYEQGDFELSETEDSFPTQGVGAITGTVTVKNKKTAAERSYAAGHATAWVIAFARDLHGGVFGRVPDNSG